MIPPEFPPDANNQNEGDTFVDLVRVHFRDGDLDELSSIMERLATRPVETIDTYSVMYGWLLTARLAMLKALQPNLRTKHKYELLSQTQDIIWQQLMRPDCVKIVGDLRLTPPKLYNPEDRELLMLLSGVMGDYSRGVWSESNDNEFHLMASAWYRQGLRLSGLADETVPANSPMCSLDRRYAVWHLSLLKLHQVANKYVSAWPDNDMYFINPLEQGLDYLMALKHLDSSPVTRLKYTAALTHFASHLNTTFPVPKLTPLSAEVDQDLLTTQVMVRRQNLQNMFWKLLTKDKPRFETTDPGYFSDPDRPHY